MTDKISYSIIARYRPIRIAFLIDPEKTSNEELNSIIEFNFEKWGGRYNPIIPCNGSDITHSFWNLLEFSDPDVIYSYVDLEDKLIEKIDKKISPYYFSVNTKKDNHHFFVHDSENTLRNDFLINEIPNLGYFPWFVHKCPLAVFKVDRNESNYSMILRNFGYLKHLIQVYWMRGDKKSRIKINEMYRDIDVVEIDGRKDLKDIINDLSVHQNVIYPMFISENRGSLDSLECEDSDRGFILGVGDNLLNYLYLWNRIHILEGYLKKSFLQMYIPEHILKNEELLESIKNLLKKYIHRDSHGSDQLFLISCDKTQKELDNLADYFRKGTYWNVKIKCSSENFQFPIIKNINGIDRDYKRLGDTYRVQDNNVLIPNKGPIPIESNSAFPSGNWMMDLDIEYRPERFFYTNADYWWKLPKRSGLTYLFMKGAPSRINRNKGISFRVQSTDKNIQIQIPDDRSIFHQLITPKFNYFYRADIRKKKDIHYNKFLYSDKGRYLEGVINHFPSLWHASHCFSNRFWRKIFKYLSNIKEDKTSNQLVRIRKKVGNALKTAIEDYPKNNERATEYLSNFLHAIMHESKEDRLLTFEKLYQIADDERLEFLNKQSHKEGFAYTEENLKSELTEALQQLTNAKILLQGVRPRCPFCKYSNWFTLNEIKDEMVCEGCHSSFNFPAEITWYYKLNELIRNTITQQGVMATLICLDQILDQSRRSFIYSPNIELYNKYKDKDPSAEIDIICINEGKFIIGEVKNSGKLLTPSDISKMEKLALELRPDKVIIYAFEKPYENSEKLTQQLKETLDTHGIEVEFMKPDDYINDAVYYLNAF